MAFKKAAKPGDKTEKKFPDSKFPPMPMKGMPPKGMPKKKCK